MFDKNLNIVRDIAKKSGKMIIKNSKRIKKVKRDKSIFHKRLSFYTECLFGDSESDKHILDI